MSLAGVFLLGLRGSGKTELGRALASEMGYSFFDSDEEIAKRSGKTPGEWIRDEGIAAFRKVEGEVLDALWEDIEHGSCVLALGGGSVDSPGVRRRLHDLRSRLWAGVWLLVPPDELVARRGGELVARPGGELGAAGASDVATAAGAADAEQRPPIAGRNVLEEQRILLARRAGAFRELSDLRFDNGGDDVQGAAERLCERLRLEFGDDFTD